MTKSAPAQPNLQLRRERMLRGWSQKQVADAIDTNTVMVSRWESGIMTPGPHFRQLLCNLFGKNVEELGFVPIGEDISEMLPSPHFWSVPFRRNPYFTGREALLAHLADLLAPTSAIRLPIALTGLGGIGKTQTAVEFAYRHAQDYDAVLWARADTPEQFKSDLVAFADTLQLPNKGDSPQMLAVVRRWLTCHKRWLIIVDNVEDLDQIAPLLPPDTGHLLLTMRNRVSGTIALGVELDPLPHDDATLFLLRRAKVVGLQEDISQIPAAVRTATASIASRLGCYPLALDQAGAYIEETGCPPALYLTQFEQEPLTLLARRGGMAADHPDSVYTTITLALDQLGACHPLALELLRVCAWLNPDGIPCDIIRMSADELGPDLASLCADPLLFDSSIAWLQRFAFVQRQIDTNLLTMHRLVQVIVQSSIERATRQRWEERMMCWAAHVFADYIAVQDWKRCQIVLPHMFAIIEQLPSQHQSAAGRRLISNVGHHLFHCAHYEQSLSLLTLLLLNLYIGGC
jgi:transcriptional regulator with XRE-family HTH domain